MDWLESMNIRSLPEQQTRLSHHPNVGQVLSEEPNICLGFDACCFCAKLLQKKKGVTDAVISCPRCQRVNYCSEECRRKDADPNLPPYNDESDDQDDMNGRQTKNKTDPNERRRSSYMDENSNDDEDDDEGGHNSNPSGLVDVMMEPGGHSPTVCSLLKLCSIDEEVEHLEQEGNGSTKKEKAPNKKECHHYHNNKKHNQLLQKQQEREASIQRIVSELESYPATLANILNEGPCFQKVFDQNPKKELLSIHIIGSSNGSELWPTFDEVVTQTMNVPQDAPPSLTSSSTLSSLVMPYTQAYTQALGDTLVDSHVYLKAIKLLFVGPDCPLLKKKQKVGKVTRRSSAVCSGSSATGDSCTANTTASNKSTDPDPHGLLLNAGANAGHNKRKRGMSFDRTKTAVPDSPKLPSSPSPPPPTCSYKGPPKQDPHKECKIVIDTYCSTYDELMNRQKSNKTKINHGCSSPKQGSNSGDIHNIMSSSSSSSSPTTSGNGTTTTSCASSASSPDIVIMFNPGFTCPDYTWMDTLDCIKRGTPFLVTTNTEMEALAELQFLFDNHYISELPSTAADIILHRSCSDNDDDDDREEDDYASSVAHSDHNAVDKDSEEAVVTIASSSNKTVKKKENGYGTSLKGDLMMFFGENPYCGLRVRQSGTMANDLFVKSRWMYGGLWGRGGKGSSISRKDQNHNKNSTNNANVTRNVHKKCFNFETQDKASIMMHDHNKYKTTTKEHHSATKNSKKHKLTEINNPALI